MSFDVLRSPVQFLQQVGIYSAPLSGEIRVLD